MGARGYLPCEGGYGDQPALLLALIEHCCGIEATIKARGNSND